MRWIYLIKIIIAIRMAILDILVYKLSAHGKDLINDGVSLIVDLKVLSW